MTDEHFVFLDTIVNLVDVVRPVVAEIRFADFLFNAGSPETILYCHAKRMEARFGFQFFHAATVQKIEPLFREALGFCKSLPGLLLEHWGKQWREFWVQRFDAHFAALLVERDGVAAHVPHGIHVGFVESDAVVVSDEKARPQKMMFGLRLFVDAVHNHLDVFIGVLRKLLCGDSRKLQLATGIALGKPAPNRLLHDKREKFEFKHGGVMACVVFAIGLVGFFAPVQIVGAMDIHELPRHGDLDLVEIHSERAPCCAVAIAAVGLILVSICNEFKNPSVPPFVLVGCGGLSLFESLAGFEFLSSPSSVAIGVKEAGGLSNNVACFRIAKFYPPERRINSSMIILTFENACHVFLCASVCLWRNNEASGSRRKVTISDAKCCIAVSPVQFRPQPPPYFIGLSSFVCPECAHSHFFGRCFSPYFQRLQARPDCLICEVLA
jgi:hypothetical protein